MPFIQVRWADNTAQLKANLKQGVDQIEVTRAAVDKLVKSFSGENLIAAANKFAVAIEKVGGVANLTAANQARVNSVMTKAVEVLEAAGKGSTDLATHFRALADATKQVEEPANRLGGFFADLGKTIAGTAAGFITAEAILGTFKAVVSGVGSELAALTVHGAAVADVEENFKRLTAQAGILGKTLLTELRAGTHNTISDFDLMTRANQNLAAGLNLTDKQFGTLAKGAFALAQATGVDVKSALDTMNDAMLTGRTRALALLTGKIDLKKAEEDFAASLGTTADHLSDELKLEAARAAILKSVGEATERLGAQTDGLDERIAQLRTAWANFEEDLGKTIATSKVLETGIEGLGQILVDTFGGHQATLVEAIASAIEDAEIAFVRFAQTGVQAGGAIAKEFIAVEKLLGNVAQVLDGLRVTALYAQKAVLAGTIGQKSPAEQAAFDANDTAIQKTLEAAVSRGKWLKELDQQQKDVAVSTDTWTKRLEDLQHKMEATKAGTDAARKAAADFVGPLQDEAAASQRAGDATEQHRKLLQQTSAEKAKAKAETDRLKKATEEIAIATGGYGKILADIPPEIVKQVQALQQLGVSEASLQTVYKLKPIQLKAIASLTELQTKLLVLDTTAIVDNTDAWQKLGRQDVETIRSLKAKFDLLEKLSKIENVKVGKLDVGDIGSIDVETIGRLKETLANIHKTFRQELEGTFKGIPDLLIQSLLGGGGVSGAFKALGVQLGKDFIDGLTQELKKAQTNKTSGINATTLGAAGGIGGLSAAGAEASGATGKQALGTAALTSVNVGVAAASLGASIGTSVALGAATFGVGAGVVAAIEIYKKKHKGQWEKLGIDIGNAFGVNLSKETLKAWEKESKVFGTQATGILHLDEIIAAAGGIAKFGFEKAFAGAHDLFSLIAQGKITTSQAAAELDKLWPSLAQGGTDAYGRISDKLKELIKLNQQYKTDSKEIAAFLKQQGSNVISGFNATVDVLGTSTSGGVEFSKIAADVKTAKDAVDALVKDGKQGTREWEDAVKKLTDAQAVQKQAAVASKEALDDLGVQALGAYAAAVAAGASEAEALAAISPSLKTLRESYKNLGLDVEDVGVKALLMQDAILNGTGKLGAGVNGLNQEFVALDNLGLLNADTFASLERTGQRMFEKLQAAAIENGGTQKDALIPMQQFLHQAADAAEKYGYKLDDATQAMIDASKAQGIWKDKPDPTKDLNQGLKDLIKSVNDLINALRGIPPKVKSEVEITTTRKDDGGGGGGGGDKGDGGGDKRAATGGIVRSWGIQHLAAGGLAQDGRVLPFARAAHGFAAGRISATFTPQGTDTVAAMLTPGEAVIPVSSTKVLGLDVVKGLIQIGKQPGAAARVVIARIREALFGPTEQPASFLPPWGSERTWSAPDFSADATPVDPGGITPFPRAPWTEPSVVFSQGGVVGGSVVPFPRGRDLIPQRLADGGFIETPQQQRVVQMLQGGTTSVSQLLATGTDGVRGTSTTTAASAQTRGPVELVLQVDRRELGRIHWDPETLSGDVRQRARAQIRQMDKER